MNQLDLLTTLLEEIKIIKTDIANIKSHLLSNSTSNNNLNINDLLQTTNVSISFTDYLNSLNINREDLQIIFEANTYDEGFMNILRKYILPDNISQFPLRAFKDKNGQQFYCYDNFSETSNDDNLFKWQIIPSNKLALKLQIIKQKIMREFSNWQNDHLHLLSTSQNFQTNYHTQIQKLTSGVIDKYIQTNSTFRNDLFNLIKI
tara:strand:+ start:1439 stop:2050 length:612 start_codon:yes stop_codon:yes gene_type:complete